VVLCIQNRAQPHQVFESWERRVVVVAVAHVSALRPAARVSLALGEEDAMSCSLLLVLWWYLLAVTLLQPKHRWEKANLIMKALDCS